MSHDPRPTVAQVSFISAFIIGVETAVAHAAPWLISNTADGFFGALMLVLYYCLTIAQLQKGWIAYKSKPILDKPTLWQICRAPNRFTDLVDETMNRKMASFAKIERSLRSGSSLSCRRSYTMSSNELNDVMLPSDFLPPPSQEASEKATPPGTTKPPSSSGILPFKIPFFDLL